MLQWRWKRLEASEGFISNALPQVETSHAMLLALVLTFSLERG